MSKEEKVNRETEGNGNRRYITLSTATDHFKY